MEKCFTGNECDRSELQNDLGSNKSDGDHQSSQPCDKAMEAASITVDQAKDPSGSCHGMATRIMSNSRPKRNSRGTSADAAKQEHELELVYERDLSLDEKSSEAEGQAEPSPRAVVLAEPSRPQMLTDT